MAMGFAQQIEPFRVSKLRVGQAEYWCRQCGETAFSDMAECVRCGGREFSAVTTVLKAHEFIVAT